MASINVHLRGYWGRKDPLVRIEFFLPIKWPSYLIILTLAIAAFEANKSIVAKFTYPQCVGHSQVFPLGRSRRSSPYFQLIGPVSDVMFRNLNFRILIAAVSILYLDLG